MVLFKKKGVINNYIMKPIIAQYLNVKLNDKIPVYGAKKVKLNCINGSVLFNKVILINKAYTEESNSIEFPIINGKSPMYLTITALSKENTIVRVLIEEFGGTPSASYFEDGA